jgi:hypothetical protein
MSAGSNAFGSYPLACNPPSDRDTRSYVSPPFLGLPSFRSSQYPQRLLQPRAEPICSEKATPQPAAMLPVVKRRGQIHVKYKYRGWTSVLLYSNPNRHGQVSAGGRQGCRRSILNHYTTKDVATFARYGPFDCRRRRFYMASYTTWRFIRCPRYFLRPFSRCPVSCSFRRFRATKICLSRVPVTHPYAP